MGKHILKPGVSLVDKKPQNQKQSTSSSSFFLKHKKKVFTLIAVLIPLFLILLTEIGLRIFNYGTDPKLFVSTPDENSKYYGINMEVAKRYFTKLSDVPTPRKDLFLKVKPKNCYRIFVLGESTAAGFPYGNNLTFTRILNRRLSDTFPDRYIEIVNTGMTAINSYTQLDFMDEILEQKPDAILIYSGHNEYYGALGVGSMESAGKYRWIVKATLTLQRFRLYQLMRSIITGVKKLTGGNQSKEDPSATLMERIVENKLIPLNGSDYNLGKVQFKENLSEIVNKAQNAGVKVIISELVSNIRDNKPFVSVNSGSLPPAREVYETGENLEKQGKYDEAKKAYYRAKDLDALRFRAPEEFNEIIHEIGNEYKIPVVPMKFYFESNSPNGLIGNNLMHEHLHPNKNGYFLMADAFFNTIKNQKLISNDWDEKKIKPTSFYANNWGFTSLDSTYASLSIYQLKGGWPFKKSQGPNLTLLNYVPTTKIDSTAIDILTTGEMTLEQGHIELAKYYDDRGEVYNSFREFNALIYTHPFLDLFYEPAVQELVKLKDYAKALEVLNESLKYNETAFAYQWIGQIYLINNETIKGITFLEKAIKAGSVDFALFFNLGRAYYKLSEFKKGDEVLEKLKQMSASPVYLSNLEEFKEYSQRNFTRAKELVNHAHVLLKNNEIKKANILLNESLQIQETSFAYELLGLIEALDGKKDKSITCFENANALSEDINPGLMYSLSNAYYVNGELNKAVITFNQIKKVSPNYPDPLSLEKKLKRLN